VDLALTHSERMFFHVLLRKLEVMHAASSYCPCWPCHPATGHWHAQTRDAMPKRNRGQKADRRAKNILSTKEALSHTDIIYSCQNRTAFVVGVDSHTSLVSENATKHWHETRSMEVERPNCVSTLPQRFRANKRESDSGDLRVSSIQPHIKKHYSKQPWNGTSDLNSLHLCLVFQRELVTCNEHHL
jgi:hypothetical protein